MFPEVYHQQQQWPRSRSAGAVLASLSYPSQCATVPLISVRRTIPTRRVPESSPTPLLSNTVTVKISKSITRTLQTPRTSVHEVLVANTTQTYSFRGLPTSTELKQAHINLFASPRDISQPRCCLARLHTR